MAKKERQKQMYLLVEKWQKSSSSKKEICLENNVNVGTFNYWLKKYRKDKSLEFIEIKPESNNSDFKFLNTIVKFNLAGNITAEVPAELAMKFMHELAVS